ncbi:hypothetical protein GE09DRAFT_43549 [Coniochaeta sp. 2T2.1]|nr:hypothetical protein GE09DRAFT_43549 [Coniochaeta sp. 2T2.1]
MSYLVSEFFINPVLRQARRFSSGFATAAEPDDNLATCSATSLPPSNEWSVVEEDDPGAAATTELTNTSLTFTTDDPSITDLRNMASVEQIPRPQLNPSTGATDDLTSDSHNNTSTQQQQHHTMAQEMAPSPTPPSPLPTSGGSHSHSLPEDDGMGLLRKRIIAIQAQDHLAQDDKAKLMHGLLMEGYNRSQVRTAVRGVSERLRPESKYMWEQALSTSPSASGGLESYKFWNHIGEGLGGLSLKVDLSEADLRPTYVPPTREKNDGDEGGVGVGSGVRLLGCEHYRRNVKMQCATCDKWYTCRLCHDAAEDHQLPRKETQHMLCMRCGCAQKVGDTCIKCGETAARYYCGVCKLWNDDPDKSVYHCDGCGICRVGQGLGKDFFHCNKCAACIAVSILDKHKCIERSTDRDCPICGDNMFDSVKRVIFMSCGHTIHHSCFKDLLKTSYRCPLCNKSVVNMEIQFRNYDAAIQSQPMPEDYRDARAVVSCNDCSAKSQTAYHWLGLRCSICQSYNTVALQLLNLPSNALPVPGSEVAALAVGAGAGAMSPSQGMDMLPSPPLAAVAPPSMTIGPSAMRFTDEARPRQHDYGSPWAAAGQQQPSLPQETSESSIETATSSGPAYSTQGPGSPMMSSPLPTPAAAVQPRMDPDDDEIEDADGYWDGDVLGHILSSPGESDNDADSQGPGSEDEETGSEDEDIDDDDDEEGEDDDKEDRLMLPGHR